MATQKKHPKMEPKLVSSKENHESEVKYIARRYKIPIKNVREAMLVVGKNYKPGRSREAIYDKLKEMGYIKKSEPTKAPKMIPVSQVRLDQGIPL